MYSLTIGEAKNLVRKNLDEQLDNYSSLMEDIDSSELDSIITKTLPEAINEVHLSAPVDLLDGEGITSEEYVNNLFDIDEDGVLTFGISKPFLRLVRFKAKDSRYVVSEVYPEVSPEGRMQLNPYTRGSSRNPKMVLLQGKDAVNQSIFRYYALYKSYTSPIEAIDKFEYIPMYRYVENTPSYKVSERLVEDVINRLTGRVLAIFKSQMANYYLGNQAPQEGQ